MVVPFNTPWKYMKTPRFLKFPGGGGIEMYTDLKWANKSFKIPKMNGFYLKKYG